MSRNRTDQGLADHARSIWRRKLFVVLGLAAGLALGTYVLPKAASAPSYRATVRIDVRPMHADVLSQTVGGTGGGTAKGTGLEPTSALQDVNVARTVLRGLGPRAPRLSAVRNLQRAAWPGALAKSIAPTAVPASSQWDLAYSDRDPRLAGMAVQRYAQAFARARNHHDQLLIDRGQQKLRRTIQQLQAQINGWAAQAQSEANASLRHKPTIATAGQLDSLRNDLKAANDALHGSENQLLFLDPSTSVLTPPVVAPANQPIAKAVYLLLGLLIGLAAGFGAALLTEAVRPKVVSVEDLERATRLVPVGGVPSVGVHRKKPQAVVARPFSPAAEGYRKVAAELERRGLGGDIKVLAILSADRREGKSTLTVNLAHALADEERDVVVISGDLRRPDVERFFEIQPKAGLADLLRSDQGDPVRLLQPVAEHLLVLPAGMPDRNPAELLRSSKLRKAVEGLRGVGSLILIDTPPASSLADALCLANCADAVLLVARSGTSRARSLEDLAAGVRRVDYRAVGAVLVDSSRGPMRPGDLRHAYGRRVDAFPPIPQPQPLSGRRSNGSGTAAAPGNGQHPFHLEQEPPLRPQPQPPSPHNESEELRASSSTEETA